MCAHTCQASEIERNNWQDEISPNIQQQSKA